MNDYNPWALPDYQLQQQHNYILQCCNYYQHQCTQLYGELRYAYQVIENINYSKKDYTPRRIEQSSNGEWYCTERNDRKVTIGNLSMKSCKIINIKPNQTFDALYCTLEDDAGSHKVVIPYKDLTHRNILPYLLFFRRNLDCPDRYITDLFFILFQNFVKNNKDEIKFLSFENYSGWNEFVNENSEPIINFVSYNNDDPYIEGFCPDAVKKRKLPPNKRFIMDVAKEYSEKLPDNWKYKFLVVMRLSSLLLFFFSKNHVATDKMFIIEPAHSSNARLIISLLKNMNYDSITTYSLTQTPTEISKELKAVNDGIAIFRYDSLIENNRYFSQNINHLHNDLLNASGDEENTRHLITVITQYPDRIPESNSTFFISFSSDDINISEDETKNLQKISGEFDSAFINSIVEFPSDSVTKIQNAINSAKNDAQNADSEIKNTLITFYATAKILLDYGVLNDKDIIKIKNFVEDGGDASGNSDQKIVNQFYHVLNRLICEDKFKFVNQNKPPYYNEYEPCIFENENCINLNRIIFKDIIAPSMNINYHSLTKALKNTDSLISTKDNKRSLKIMLSQYDARYIDFYSISKELLSKTALAKLEIFKNSDYLFPINDISVPHITPIINTYDVTHTTGIQLKPDSDENFHMYVTGVSGAGKTYFLMQQALFRAQTDDKVIIFDNGGSFDRDRLEKIFKDKTEEVINKYISYHYISTDKIPVDLFSLEGINSSDEKTTDYQAARLADIITATSTGLGAKQKNALGEKLKKVAKHIENDNLSNDNDYSNTICKEIIHIITQKDMADLKLDDRLTSILGFIQNNMIRQTWGDFFSNRKKIIIIITGQERNALGANIIDLMLASLNAYKSYITKSRYSVIIDELGFLNTSDSGTICHFAKASRQNNLSLILASQHFMKEKLNSFIGNFGTKVFFQPTDSSIAADEINKYYKTDKRSQMCVEKLNKLETGECVVCGSLYNKSNEKNIKAIIEGKTADFIGSYYYPIELPEPIIEESLDNTSAVDNAPTTNKLSVFKFSKKKLGKLHRKNSNNIFSNKQEESLEQIQLPQTYITVKVLMEDTKDDSIYGLSCEIGLSLYIEYYDKKILLDAGQSGKFIDNAWHMDVDLEQIDFAVLSHAYNDHSGGFNTFFARNTKVKVYARQEIQESYYNDNYNHSDISAPWILRKERGYCIKINESKQIFSGIYLIEHNAPNLEEISKRNGLHKFDNIPDDFRHEQTLVFDTPNGLVVFNSCSNGGVINIIKEVKHFIKGRPIYAYIGGFHITHPQKDGTEIQLLTDEEISQICNFIKQENIKHIYTGHCTGEIGFEKLKEQLGDIVHSLTTGMVFEL